MDSLMDAAQKCNCARCLAFVLLPPAATQEIKRFIKKRGANQYSSEVSLCARCSFSAASSLHVHRIHY
ncbi:hypothetical protein XELAEV_18044313mg [Xenopus laevis]|uniref:Uncharacterized protein n=1 Tax=Xenopus laevis TaxID=8355 RepID=A0A974H3N8_XENLA|nr:hypothetical protein XELAEV_18044313mg [Xenopus laevis]